MSRAILAIAAMLLPLPVLAQAAPAAAPQADRAMAVPEQARPEQRGFSIARPGSAPAAPIAAAHGPAPHAQMAAPSADMPMAKPGMMKHHAKRHHRRHKRHHH